MKTLFAQPLVTEKSMSKSADGTYQFIVPLWANKRQIASHIAEHYNVTIIAVQTSKMPGKAVSFKRKTGQQSTYKKATLRLKPGDTISEFSLPIEAPKEVTPTSPEREPSTPTESKITIRSKSGKSSAQTAPEEK
jgi:large subunit ribosomal protein L23